MPSLIWSQMNETERQRRYTTHSDNVPLAMSPTQAAPGSQEKIEVMRSRVANGAQPFHPCDAVYVTKQSSARHQGRVRRTF